MSSGMKWREAPKATGSGTQVLQEEGPLPGPKSGLLSNTQKWIVQGDARADKARDFIGKGHQGKRT